jgi:hypothetical protein
MEGGRFGWRQELQKAVRVPQWLNSSTTDSHGLTQIVHCLDRSWSAVTFRK